MVDSTTQQNHHPKKRLFLNKWLENSGRHRKNRQQLSSCEVLISMLNLGIKSSINHGAMDGNHGFLAFKNLHKNLKKS